MSVQVERLEKVIYPESDGKPMADNTLQAQYIVYLFDGLRALFREDPDVFIAADLLWYPVEGDPQTRVAPDVMVAFGRPKGYRGSYLQWREENIPPQVVFEIWSPSNTYQEFADKLLFYERFGVEEFYLYDPERGQLEGWVRKGDRLVVIDKMEGWVSPRLGIKFTLEGKDLIIYRPDGEAFLLYEELQARYEEAQKRLGQERQRAEQERQRAERLAQRLKELGVEVEE